MTGLNLVVSRLLNRYRISDLFLFLYVCALFAHRTGAGFDYYFVRGTFVLYVFAYVLFDIVPSNFRNKKNGSIKTINKSTAWFLCFWALAFCSALWSVSIKDTLSPLYITNAIQSFFLLLCIVDRINDKDDVQAMMTIVLAGSLYCCVMLMIKTPSSVWGSERVGEVLGLNSNAVGMIASIGALLAMYERQLTRKPFFLILIVVFVAVALFSGSRKAVLVIALSLILFYSFSEKGIRGLINAIIAIAAIVGLFWLVMTNADLYNVIGERLERSINFLTGGLGAVDQSDVERAFYREYAMQMFADKPIVGYGFNGFYAQMKAINYSHPAYAHCNELELLADLGIVGFCIYYSLHIYLLAGFARNLKKSRLECILGITFIVVIVVTDYFIVSCVNPNTYIYLAILFGMLNCLNASNAQNRIEIAGMGSGNQELRGVVYRDSQD